MGHQIPIRFQAQIGPTPSRLQTQVIKIPRPCLAFETTMSFASPKLETMKAGHKSTTQTTGGYEYYNHFV